VPPDLYTAAAAEMAAIMKRRGFPLPTSGAIEGDHFLIQGTPIVSE
jgi:hypothetical protein